MKALEGKNETQVLNKSFKLHVQCHCATVLRHVLKVVPSTPLRRPFKGLEGVRRPDGSVGMALVLPALTNGRWWFKSLLVHSGVSSATRKATGADHKKSRGEGSSGRFKGLNLQAPCEPSCPLQASDLQALQAPFKPSLSPLQALFKSPSSPL